MGYLNLLFNFLVYIFFYYYDYDRYDRDDKYVILY